MKQPAGEGMIMIIVAHETGFAKEIAGRIRFKDTGNIVEESTPEQIFQTKEPG